MLSIMMAPQPAKTRPNVPMPSATQATSSGLVVCASLPLAVSAFIEGFPPAGDETDFDTSRTISHAPRHGSADIGDDERLICWSPSHDATNLRHRNRQHSLTQQECTCV